MEVQTDSPFLATYTWNVEKDAHHVSFVSSVAMESWSGAPRPSYYRTMRKWGFHYRVDMQMRRMNYR